MRVFLFLLLVLSGLVACGDDDTVGDTAVARDSGATDSGDADSGAADSGAVDSGADARATDSGTIDSGTIDSGTIDSGTDAGATDATDAPDTSCPPTCDGSRCGEDGCGGTCACEGDDVCTPELTCAAPMTTSCPPTGPFGTEVGDVLANATAFDCDGNPVTLHSLCEREVSWVITYADWCSTCRSFAAGSANAIRETYADDDVEGYLVITEDSSRGAPTTALCAQVRDRYSLEIGVLIDRDGSFSAALGAEGRSHPFVMTEGNVIAWEQFFGDSMLSSQIATALGR